MAGPDPGPFAQFAEFVAVTRAKHIGHDIAENAKPYVPLSALQEYWTPAKILSVLRAFPDRPGVNVGVIRRSCLRIFSTLVYTDRETVRSLADLFISHNITDDRLPWSRRPSEWPDADFHNNFFDKIADNQWQFFPFHFHPDHLYNRPISDHCVLPIDFKENIVHGNVASVCTFDIHPEYNDLVPKVCFSLGLPCSSPFHLPVDTNC